jgi:hypothetical protein
MHPGRRSSSSRTAALFVLTAVLGISGCAGRTAMLGGDQPLRLNTINDTPQIAAATAPSPRIAPVAESPASEDIVATAAPAARSAWCEYLAEDAAADATILRAPTLGGQVDDAGKSSVSLSLSLSGLRKAKLIEESAEARCRRHLAEAGLQKMAFLAPQDLSAAGFRSRARAITSQAATLEKLRVRVRREMNAGNLTADRAAALTAIIDNLYSIAAEARSQADRRDTMGAPLTGAAAEYGAALLRAEDDLDAINSQIRTADAFDVSLEAGYSDADVNDGFDSADEGISGKVKFSMKLGAFAPQRYEHERRAKAARLAAIRNQEGGALWQIGALREAHLRAIAGLEESRGRLERAIAETSRFMAVVDSTPEQEFAGASIEARLRMIQLESDRAAVTGSLAEIRSKLKTLAPG